MYFEAAAIGGLVGFLVASLGIGAGAIATPLLILTGIPPLQAVGSNLLFALPLKAFTSTLYRRRGEVDTARVKHLLLGSLPALLASYLVLSQLSTLNLELLSRAVKTLIGLTLIAVSAQYLVKPPLSSNPAKAKPGHLALTGFAVGALTLLTSVGSGVIVMAALLRLKTPPRKAVGTTLLYSLTVTAIAALLHYTLKTINPALTLTLLSTSIPTAYLGFKAAMKLPREKLLRNITLAIMALGALTILT